MAHLRLLPAQQGVFFDEKEHRYLWSREWRGVEVPSSSLIIELAGGKDFNKDPWIRSLLKKGLTLEGAHFFMEKVRNIRASIGTEVHSLIAQTLNVSHTYHCPNTSPCEEALAIHRQWQENVYPRIGAIYIIEQPMIHPGGCYGFTPDLVAEIDGCLTNADWKSNQAEEVSLRYEYLKAYEPHNETLAQICDHLQDADAKAGKTSESTAKVRGGWQHQQGSYAFGVDAVHGLRVERGLNFMLSVDGAKERQWNRADLDQGWLRFAGGLYLHHQRSVINGGHFSYKLALDALQPLMRC